MAVVIVGLVAAPNGIAEGLAVLGFFGYLLYLVAAAVVLFVAARPAPEGSSLGLGVRCVHRQGRRGGLPINEELPTAARVNPFWGGGGGGGGGPLPR